MTDQSVEGSPRDYARVAGFLYLIVIVCAGFGEGFVRANLIVPGDAGATAANVLESPGLFRLAFVGDLIAFLCDAAIAVLLYVLLRPVSRTLSLLAGVFRLLAHPAIASINLLNHFAVLFLVDRAGYLSVFDPQQTNALALFFLDLHKYGYLIGGAFFGVHCALLGYLLVRSPLFPTTLGVLLSVASVGYLTESFIYFLFPMFEALATPVVVITAGVAEISLCLWLIIKGVKNSAPIGQRR